MTTQSNEASEKSRNLRLRILSSVILVPAVLFLVYVGGLAYQAAVIATMILALREWTRMTGDFLSLRLKTTALIGLFIVLACGTWLSITLSLCVGFAMTLFLYFLTKRERGDFWFAFCLPYLGGSGLSLIALRGHFEKGDAILFYLLLTVWATDIGGFLAGRLIGGPKLCPRISPNKTWSGLMGCMVLAGLAGYGLCFIYPAMNVLYVVVLSVILSLTSQAGDFFESYIKRRSGRKDSGTLIPGHGGVLDRIDGLLSSAIFLALLLVGLSALPM